MTPDGGERPGAPDRERRGPDGPERAAFTGADAAAAGMTMLAINLVCAGIGAGIGALVGALVPFLLTGFFVGFAIAIFFVIRRFKSP